MKAKNKNHHKNRKHSIKEVVILAALIINAVMNMPFNIEQLTGEDTLEAKTGTIHINDGLISAIREGHVDKA